MATQNHNSLSKVFPIATEATRKVVIAHLRNRMANWNESREHAPSIIFMAEIDSIGFAGMESGSDNGHSEVQRTMLELLKQLDGLTWSVFIQEQTVKKTMWI
ncbi:hypothetical protein IFM89_007415 [Coptis chinensis]|uniref:ATPase AAA-type core domain-containing protein n=1 Tax=Coptis chinensis TaxID=261450 RepID=A0A835IXD0_9MAGN|nr:hypothetical protein IFM89_007415 [Coptis chinensis]